MYHLFYVQVFSINYFVDSFLMDDSGRVHSPIISVACQIQRFGFVYNMVVARKLMIASPPALCLTSNNSRYIVQLYC